MIQSKVDAIKMIAERLLKANNTVTCLEIKTELFVCTESINGTPCNELFWDEQMVSDVMSQNHGQWAMSWVTTSNPVPHRVYSYANSPINQPTSAPTSAVATAAPTAKATASVKSPKAKTAKPVVASSKATYISRGRAIAEIEKAGGCYFTAVFIKKPTKAFPKGEKRSMNCQVLKGQTPSKMGYIKVNLPGKLKAGEKAIRSINLQTLKELKIKGQYYKIR